MWQDIVLGFVAGFFAGNGLPYYVAGSLADGANPSPFPDRPRVSVIVGVVGVATGALAWHFVGDEGLASRTAAALGIACVGLIHAGNWRSDPWGKNRRARH